MSDDQPVGDGPGLTSEEAMRRADELRTTLLAAAGHASIETTGATYGELADVPVQGWRYPPVPPIPFFLDEPPAPVWEVGTTIQWGQQVVVVDEVIPPTEDEPRVTRLRVHVVEEAPDGE